MEPEGTSVAHSLCKSVHENNTESLTSLSGLKNCSNQSQSKHDRALCSPVTSLLISHSLEARVPSDCLERGEGRFFS